MTVTPTTPGVVHIVEALPNGGYRHVLILPEEVCQAPCRYTFKVYSAINPANGEWSQEKNQLIAGCMW